MENVNNECDTHGSLEDNKGKREVCPHCGYDNDYWNTEYLEVCNVCCFIRAK